MALGFPAGTSENSSPVGLAGQTCGPNSVNNGYGCGNGGNPPRGQSTTQPSTFNLVNSYASNNQLFLNSFAAAFDKMVSIGYTSASLSTNGKIGTLTSINLNSC